MAEPIIVKTPGCGMVDITSSVQKQADTGKKWDGLIHLFIQHTSASLIIQENADPDVQHDLVAHFNRLAPQDAAYKHTAEGPDDMPAHIKTALTSTSLSIPVWEGRLMLGVWQGVYVFEHRTSPQERRVIATLISV